MFQGALDVRNRFAACFRIAGAVRKQNAVRVFLQHIVIPRAANHRDIPAQQGADDVIFDAAVHDRHALVAIAIDNRLAHADFGGQIPQIVIHKLNRFVIVHDFAKHDAAFAQAFRQGAGVNPGNARHALLFQPIRQRPFPVPMRKMLAAFRDNQRLRLNAVRFEIFQHAVAAALIFRDAVIPNQRVGHGQ